MSIYPLLQALLAALLFGASAPVAKLLLGQIDPVMLAALLYWGSGGGMMVFKLFSTRHEAPLSRADWPWLFGAVVAGGVAAPIVLMISLKHTDAATASLLFNFEGVATAIIAAVFFQEAIGRRAATAFSIITLASILLSWQGVGGFSWGALGVLGACVLWSVDNNLTRQISAKDPLTIVMVKGVVAGTCSFGIALSLGQSLPPTGQMFAALALGGLSYGLSIALFVQAMRQLGAARTTALFGAAPIAGVVVSLLLFQEWPSLTFWLAFPLMLGGAFLLLNEGHAHHHEHEFMHHEHRHDHNDGHHDHDHPVGIDPQGPHSHPHDHLPLAHDHPHTPDIHHRHTH